MHYSLISSIDHSLYSFDTSLHALLLFDHDYVVACHLGNYFVLSLPTRGRVGTKLGDA